MDPCRQPGLSRSSASAASSSSRVRPPRPAPSRDFRVVHAASNRGGGSRTGGSIRRAAVAQDDVREGYLVWDLTNRSTHLLEFHKCRCPLSGARSESRKCRSDTQKWIFTFLLWALPLHTCNKYPSSTLGIKHEEVPKCFNSLKRNLSPVSWLFQHGWLSRRSCLYSAVTQPRFHQVRMLQIVTNRSQSLPPNQECCLDSCDRLVPSAAFGVAVPFVYSHQKHVIKRQHNFLWKTIISYQSAFSIQASLESGSREHRF